MRKDVQDITKVFDLLETACRNIQDNDQCEDCPMSFNCLDGRYGSATAVELEQLVSPGKWEEFLDYADNCIPSERLQAEMDYARAAEHDPYDDL